MQAGGLNMTKFIVPFRKFTNAPKNRRTSDFKYQSKIYTIINDLYVGESTKWKLWHVCCVAHKLYARSEVVVEKLTAD
jgi:hypothetical protein